MVSQEQLADSKYRYDEVDQLYRERFGEEHVMIILHEDLMQEPARVLAELGSFCGIGGQVHDYDRNSRVRRTPSLTRVEARRIANVIGAGMGFEGKGRLRLQQWLASPVAFVGQHWPGGLGRSGNTVVGDAVQHSLNDFYGDYNPRFFSMLVKQFEDYRYPG